MANPETTSELAVPLIYKDKVIGVLDLEHTRRGFFTEDHKRTITTLAAQVAIAIENARLYEQIARQERRLERDLSLARELQFRLLPQAMPEVGASGSRARNSLRRAPSAATCTISCTTRMSRLGIVIGDVSGKGAPAAIYAALVSGILRSHAPMEPAPGGNAVRGQFFAGERRIEAQFVSLIYAVWDDAKRTLQIANSGLPRPIYCHDGKMEVIEATGLPLGLFDDAEYEEFTSAAKPGDMFVFFSDGILDARNRAGEMFGRERRRADHCRAAPTVTPTAWSIRCSKRSKNTRPAWRHSTTRPLSRSGSKGTPRSASDPAAGIPAGRPPAFPIARCAAACSAARPAHSSALRRDRPSQAGRAIWHPACTSIRHRPFAIA